MKKIYLAGPDVFYPDGQFRLAHLESPCAARGLQGLAPSDAGIEEELKRGTPRREIAKKIFEANVAHIRNCDAVML